LTIVFNSAQAQEDAVEFKERLAAVKKDGKYGFVDKTGNVNIPFKFDNAGYFSEGGWWWKKGKTLFIGI
jgi:hypothetical protein